MSVNLSKSPLTPVVIVEGDVRSTGLIVGRREAYVLVLLDSRDEIVKVPTS